jgi:acyl-CoA thioester hydrolase
MVSGARIILDQRVERAEVVLFAARVTLVALGRDGRPARLDSALRARLSAALA